MLSDIYFFKNLASKDTLVGTFYLGTKLSTEFRPHAKAEALWDPPHGQIKTRWSQHLAGPVLTHLRGLSLNHNGSFVASQKRDLLLSANFSLSWQFIGRIKTSYC